MSYHKRPQVDPAKAFIEGAEVEEPDRPQIVHPWEELDDMPEKYRDKYKTKRSSGVNLRLTEAELSQLQYIKKHTNKSIQAFVMDALLPAINKEIDRIDAEIIGGKK